MTTAVQRRGGCVYVRGHSTHQIGKKAHPLSLVHTEGNDVMNECVLARDTALCRSCFSTGNE